MWMSLMYKIVVFTEQGFVQAIDAMFETKEEAQTVAKRCEALGAPFLVVPEWFVEACTPDELVF
jgi:hypothetical protein